MFYGCFAVKVSCSEMPQQDWEGHMKEYSVWVDETEKIVSFHEVDNSELIYFDQREIYLAYLSALTTQGYRFQ